MHIFLHGRYLILYISHPFFVIPSCGVRFLNHFLAYSLPVFRSMNFLTVPNARFIKYLITWADIADMVLRAVSKPCPPQFNSN